MDSLLRHKNANKLLVNTGLLPKKEDAATPVKTVTTPLVKHVASATPAFKAHTFIVDGLPVAKPRMTRRDTWQKRPAVIRYRDYCDRCRAAAGQLAPNPDGLSFVAYLPMPESWPKSKKAKYAGQPHRQRSDLDNILKAIGDALFEEDSMIWFGGPLSKRWCYAGQERTEIAVLYVDESTS